MSDVLTKEADAFLRVAEVAGLELPASITEPAGVLSRVETERGALPTPEQVPTLAQIIAGGTPPDKAQNEHDRLLMEAKKAKELRAAAWSALGLAARQVSIAVAQERDNLIHGMRPIVTDLIERARPLAEALAPFAPKYDAAVIVRHASMEQVEAWRESEELERRFGACLSAWRAAWNATTTPGGHKSPAVVRDFDVRTADQASYYWQMPERVLEPRLNGTYYAPHHSAPARIQPTVLAVACERPECEFTLKTVREVADEYYANHEQARIDRDHGLRRMGGRIV